MADATFRINFDTRDGRLYVCTAVQCWWVGRRKDDPKVCPLCGEPVERWGPRENVADKPYQ